MPTKQNFVGIFYPTNNSSAPHITIGTPCTRNEVRFCSTENTIPIPSATTATTQSIPNIYFNNGEKVQRARQQITAIGNQSPTDGMKAPKMGQYRITEGKQPIESDCPLTEFREAENMETSR